QTFFWFTFPAVMSAFGEFPFIDVDEYRRKYPELCKPHRSGESEPLHELVFDATRTPASIVNEYSIKSYKQIGSAFYTETEEINQNTGIITYACTAKMMKFEGSGKSKRKGVAKQIACYELLKCAAEMDRYKDFCILAKSKAEALQMLEQIKPEDEDIAGAAENQVPAKVENFVGNLTEFCIQNKLPQPEYSYEEFGPPNARFYMAYAVIGESKGVGREKKKKKDAKSAAAQDLLKILEPQVVDLRKATDQLEGNGAELGTEDEDSEPIEGLLGVAGVNVSRAQTEPEPQRALETILSDKMRFLSFNCQYRDLEQPSTRGRSQSILSVQYSKAPPQPIVHPDGTVTTPKVDKDAPTMHNYVFCGEGADSKSSRDEAARMGLVHFLTYKGPREVTPAADSVES
ncbi:hypothetical protein PMAYCL1PPCAC_12847, partial [Pristionchus mayeri]